MCFCVECVVGWFVLCIIIDVVKEEGVSMIVMIIYGCVGLGCVLFGSVVEVVLYYVYVLVVLICGE